MDPVKKFATSIASPREVAPRTFRFVFSTPEVDRDRDILPNDAWDLTNFLKNPVVLEEHFYDRLPIARVVNITFNPLAGDVQFPPEGTSKRSDEAYRLVASGFARTVSVGFLPLERPVANEHGGWTYSRIELMEVSIVSVPSQPNALVAASVGAKGSRAPGQTILVNPRDLVEVTAKAVRHQVRVALCRAAGRLVGSDDSEASIAQELAVVRANQSRHRASAKGFTSAAERAVEAAPFSRDLAPVLPVAAEIAAARKHLVHAPAPKVTLLPIPPHIVRAVTR